MVSNFYSLTGADANKDMSRHIQYVKNESKGKALVLHLKTLLGIRNTFKTMEREHEIDEEQSAKIDNIMSQVLMEVHEISAGSKRNDYRYYQKV